MQRFNVIEKDEYFHIQDQTIKRQLFQVSEGQLQNNL